MTIINNDILRRALEDAIYAFESYGVCQSTMLRCQEALKVHSQDREKAINHMADRFCAWPLPEGFNPDGGVSYDRFGNKGTDREFKRDTSGTNLLSHQQAKEMIRFMIEGL